MFPGRYAENLRLAFSVIGHPPPYYEGVSAAKLSAYELTDYAKKSCDYKEVIYGQW
ncbi:hypothetical protein TUM20903_23790 [Citrobacter koseri]|nr:hypothetical protein MPUCK001_20580 [Citrobacter koseri]BDG84836.1 hypothetical protein TUM13189_23960 [Citrobacter koseri]BDG89641.1 hypothetical protein TUM20903_23790 [Citrobacter koseri]